MKKIVIFGDEKNFKKIFPKFIRDKKKVSFLFLDPELEKFPTALNFVDAVIFFPRKLISKEFLKMQKN